MQNQAADALSWCSINLVALNPLISKTQLSEAKKTDPVLRPIIDQLQTSDTPPPSSGIWKTFPYKRFKQLWPQLSVH